MQITGIRHKDHVRGDGIDRATLARWRRSGAVKSVQPWYVTRDAPAELVALLALGLRPTCLDAAALHGLWVPMHTGVHVFHPRPSTRVQQLRGRRLLPLRHGSPAAPEVGRTQPLVLHGPQLRAWPDKDPVPSLDLVLEHAGRCLPTVKAAILLESALNRRKISRPRVEQIVSSLPFHAARALSRVRSDAESGTETAMRWWFESRGVPVEAQVLFPDGVRRMDLLVGRSWVIECDSREHHTGADSYEQDRARDLYLSQHGYEVTRLSWRQVFLAWPTTEASLLAILSRGQHLRPPRPGRGLVLSA